MNDDFPTTNTDLHCTVKNTVNPSIGLDVSWGLPLNVPPASLTYYPIEGGPIEIRYVAPVSLQISWKLHQCVVRPRLKDLIDVSYLLQDVEISGEEIKIAVIEFLKECEKDRIDGRRLLYFTDGRIRKFLNKKKNFFYRLIDFTDMNPPLLNMGELLNQDIENLKYTFPNYQSKYAEVTDILLEFEAALKKYNFGKLIEENIDDFHNTGGNS